MNGLPLSDELIAEYLNPEFDYYCTDPQLYSLALEVQEWRKLDEIRKKVVCPTCKNDRVGWDSIGFLKCNSCRDGHPSMKLPVNVGAEAVAAIETRDAAYAARENGTTANIIALTTIETALRIQRKEENK